MMIKKRFLVFCLIASLLFVFFSVAASARENERRYFSALLLGFDDSASNTDVIAVAFYDKLDKNISVLQIPRDTVYKSDFNICKLNSLFPKYVSQSNDKGIALELFAEKISEILDIKLDISIAVSTSSFANLIDAIGGIDVVLPENIYNKMKSDIDFVKNGKNHFTGDEALKFVRYRKGYADGDLGRLDAQKLFFQGLIHSLKSRSSLNLIFSSALRDEGVFCSYSLGSVASMIFEASKISEANLSVLTLPGEPVTIDNISYFVPDREACISLLKSIFSDGEIAFDTKRHFSTQS